MARNTSDERECPQRHSLHDRLLRGGTISWNAGTGNIRTRFESCPERPPLAKRPVNLEGVVNQRVREFWSVWNGHRGEKWHFGTAPRISISNQRVERWETESPKVLTSAGIRKNAGHSRAWRSLSTSGERKFAPECKAPRTKLSS